MPGGGCTIDINGDDYYYPCDRSDDIYFDGGHVINSSSSTITLYGSYQVYNDNTSGYPRITIPSYGYGYRTSSRGATPTTLQVSSYEFVNRSWDNMFLNSILILGVLVCLLFKR